MINLVKTCDKCGNKTYEEIDIFYDPSSGGFSSQLYGCEYDSIKELLSKEQNGDSYCNDCYTLKEQIKKEILEIERELNYHKKRHNNTNKETISHLQNKLYDKISKLEYFNDND